MIEIKKKGDQCQFEIKAITGEVLLKSIEFEDLETLDTTLRRVKNGTFAVKNFERKTNFEGKFLFNLKNDQGNIIGSSGFYNSEAGMENGIKNLRNILEP